MCTLQEPLRHPVCIVSIVTRFPVLCSSHASKRRLWMQILRFPRRFLFSIFVLKIQQFKRSFVVFYITQVLFKSTYKIFELSYVNLIVLFMSQFINTSSYLPRSFYSTANFYFDLFMLLLFDYRPDSIFKRYKILFAFLFSLYSCVNLSSLFYVYLI